MVIPLPLPPPPPPHTRCGCTASLPCLRLNKYIYMRDRQAFLQPQLPAMPRPAQIGQAAPAARHVKPSSPSDRLSAHRGWEAKPHHCLPNAFFSACPPFQAFSKASQWQFQPVRPPPPAKACAKPGTNATRGLPHIHACMPIARPGQLPVTASLPPATKCKGVVSVLSLPFLSFRGCRPSLSFSFQSFQEVFPKIFTKGVRLPGQAGG